MANQMFIVLRNEQAMGWKPQILWLALGVVGCVNKERWTQNALETHPLRQIKAPKQTWRHQSAHASFDPTHHQNY